MIDSLKNHATHKYMKGLQLGPQAQHPTVLHFAAAHGLKYVVQKLLNSSVNSAQSREKLVNLQVQVKQEEVEEWIASLRSSYCFTAVSFTSF